jgi:hypothetical protein
VGSSTLGVLDPDPKPGATRRRVAGGLVGTAIVVVLAVGTWAGWAGATSGVGVGASPIVLAHPAYRSQRYALTPLYVINTGSESGAFRVRVQRLAGAAGGRVVPAGWVQFGHPSFTLAPRQATLVKLELVIPADAPAGAYTSDLIASTVTRQAGAVGLGASAATKLEFSVVPGSPSSGPEVPAWVWIALGAVVVVGLGVFAVRRSGLRIQVQRRPSSPSG